MDVKSEKWKIMVVFEKVSTEVDGKARENRAGRRIADGIFDGKRIKSVSLVHICRMRDSLCLSGGQWGNTPDRVYELGDRIPC